MTPKSWLLLMMLREKHQKSLVKLMEVLCAWLQSNLCRVPIWIFNNPTAINLKTGRFKKLRKGFTHLILMLTQSEIRVVCIWTLRTWMPLILRSWSCGNRLVRTLKYGKLRNSPRYLGNDICGLNTCLSGFVINCFLREYELKIIKRFPMSFLDHFWMINILVIKVRIYQCETSTFTMIVPILYYQINSSGGLLIILIFEFK